MVSPGEFRAHRLALGLTTSECAAALMMEARAVQRYEAGQRTVPGSVERLMTVILRSAQAREICGLKPYPKPVLAARDGLVEGSGPCQPVDA